MYSELLESLCLQCVCVCALCVCVCVYVYVHCVCVRMCIVYVYVIYICHGEEVYMVNIQPETEFRGSLQIYPRAEGEGYIVANYR